VWLARSHPELPSCAVCAEFHFDDDWRLRKRGGQPVRRITPGNTPCHKCPKSLDSRPHPEKELSPKNRQALWYYQQCQADPSGTFIPRDQLVIRNNAAIQQTIEECDRAEAKLTNRLLLAVAGMRAR
jgi:hypothetical protein